MTSQKTKKFISILVVLTLILTLLPTTFAFAAHKTVEGFVTNLYTKGLGRQPDEEGLNFYVEQLKSGKMTAAQVVGYVLVESPEFQSKNYTDDQFVTVIYEAFLDRERDEKGAKFWLDRLAEGYSRLWVMARFLDAPTAEFQNFCKEVGIKVGRIGTTDKDLPAAGFEIESVAAVGAKKIKVTFNKAVDPKKATFEVKREAVKPSVKSITFAEDNKSAVIEFNVALVTGDYTVTVSGVADKALTATAKIEAAKLTTIEFTSDYAVIVKDNPKQVKVGVVGKNQYGEEVSAFTPNVSASKGTGSVVSNVLTLTSLTDYYVVNEKVVVTIVEPSANVIATKTLTVAQAAQVATIDIGDLKTDDKELAAKPVNVANLNRNIDKYYIPVDIRDQYGNKLKAADLVGVDILTSNNAIINPKGFKDLSNGTTVIELQSVPDSKPTSGTVVITVVAAATGKTASTTVTVLANAKIDTVYLSAPETELKLTKAATLPITVVDTYGNELALKDINIDIDVAGNVVKLDTDTKITASGAEFSKKVNYTTGVTTIEITPKAKNIVLTVVTATNKFQSLTLTAVDAPVPTSIKGMKSSFVSMLANDTSMETSIVGNVEFFDQYGETITVQYGETTGDTTEKYYYTVESKSTSPSYTTYDETNNKINATTSAGTDVYVVKLMKGSDVLDQLEVSVTVVDKDKITSFGIEDLNKFYTGKTDNSDTGKTDNSDYNQQVKIYGIVDGKKVAVPQSMIKAVTATNGLPIALDGKYTATEVDTGNKDVNSTITVLVEAGSNNYTVTKDVVYSSAKPVASSLVVKKGSSDVNGPVEITSTALNDGNLYTGIDGLKFVAKDQYNVELKNITFVVTNNETGAKIEIDKNGKLTVKDGTPTLGKSFQINAFIDGLYKSVKVFVKQ